ncbi:MAG: phosphopyruvate hydratase [Lachnospiraceae bacterium]
MYNFLPITDVYAREILDSRGNPTIEVEVLADGKYLGRAAVPSGASTGQYEAVELRDEEKRYSGMGVQKAVDHVNTIIAREIIGVNIYEQAFIDSLLLKIDRTSNKSYLGANATLGISMAVARTAAKALHMPLYAYLGGIHSTKMPVPMMNILNGGKHADNTIDIQEFMIMPIGAATFAEGLQMCAETYHALKKILQQRGLHTGVGDEGGFAPNLPDAKEALQLMVDAIHEAGYQEGTQIGFALDVAATELYDKKTGRYSFEGEGKMHGHKISRSTEELIDYYEDLISEYPILSIEDPLDEEDWDGWELLTTRMGQEIQLVGDDLFVTNTRRLKKGIEQHVANAILIKVNQIGTLTEAINAITMAKQAGYHTIVSHRSGETEDSFIADLAVAFRTGQIKAGAPCRSERVAKYNQLLRIEEKIGDISEYVNPWL